MHHIRIIYCENNRIFKEPAPEHINLTQTDIFRQFFIVEEVVHADSFLQNIEICLQGDCVRTISVKNRFFVRIATSVQIKKAAQRQPLILMSSYL